MTRRGCGVDIVLPGNRARIGQRLQPLGPRLGRGCEHAGLREHRDRTGQEFGILTTRRDDRPVGTPDRERAGGHDDRRRASGAERERIEIAASALPRLLEMNGTLDPIGRFGAVMKMQGLYTVIDAGG